MEVFGFVVVKVKGYEVDDLLVVVAWGEFEVGGSVLVVILDRDVY